MSRLSSTLVALTGRRSAHLAAILALLPWLVVGGAVCPVAAAQQAVAPGGKKPAETEATKPAASDTEKDVKGNDNTPFERTITREGITMDLSLEPLDAQRKPGEFLEGDNVRVRLKVTDSNTGTPMTELYPAGWMDRLPDTPGVQSDSCKTKVEAFVGGTLLAEPEVDLNVYYVLAMNNDATISVVDPLFGFGGSKLLTMVFLDSPGEDWAVTNDQNRLFVSMPLSDRVAVVDTSSWKVVYDVEVAKKPNRLALQHDEHYLWVAYDGTGDEPGGVSAVDTENLKEVKRIETGAGRHDLALSTDDRYLFVSNEKSGTVSVVDVEKLEKVQDITTGSRPHFIAYSPIGRSAYVTDAQDGTVTAISKDQLKLATRMKAEPGVARIRFTPDGRYGFVVNPKENVIHILDASTNRIIQTGDTEDTPDRVAFSENLAYITHLGSDTVLMIPLETIGREGAPVPEVDFPGGQHPPGLTDMPSSADIVVEAPGATAVLLANARDEAIYFYKEGMAAPMGHFKNYERQPRAVQVIDRSLREVRPGTYETAFKMRRPGKYDLAMFVDSPRVIQCFKVNVKENPVIVHEREYRPVKVELLADGTDIQVGQEVGLKLRIRDGNTNELRDDLQDVNVLTFLAPGIWQKRQWAHSLGKGLYEVRFTPPQKGVYYVFVEIRSQGLTFNQSPSLILNAHAPGESGGTAASSQGR